MVSAPSEMVHGGGFAQVLVRSPSEMAHRGGFVPLEALQAPSVQPPSELAYKGDWFPWCDHRCWWQMRLLRVYRWCRCRCQRNCGTEEV